MPISDRCYHIPTSPGQGVCTCVDALIWARLTIECQARRIVELERLTQQGVAALLNVDAP